VNTYLTNLARLQHEAGLSRQPGAPTVISTFAGAGGSSLGYRAAGFDERLAVDHDKLAAATFSLNFPDVQVLCEDIRRISVKDVLSATGLSVGELDVLDSSPPCQCYTRNKTRHRENHDDRVELWREVHRFVVGLQPKAFVLENVPGLMDPRMIGNLDSMRQAFRAAGYRVAVRELDASRYGVPQARRRIIIIGIRSDLGISPTYPAPDLPEVHPPTVRDAFEGLPEWQPRPRPHGELAALVPQIPQGRNGGDVHPLGHWFNAYRLDWNAPANTVLATHFHNVATLHPDLDLGCSIREAMRLQGFPDAFIFVGSHRDRWRLIGNAVPPLLMWRIAAHLAGLLRMAKNAGGDGLKVNDETEVWIECDGCGAAFDPGASSELKVCAHDGNRLVLCLGCFAWLTQPSPAEGSR
jgi:DNA (cytosine-5)-methyltransferase 1